MKQRYLWNSFKGVVIVHIIPIDIVELSLNPQLNWYGNNNVALFLSRRRTI
jgi:hypothetical protein